MQLEAATFKKRAQSLGVQGSVCCCIAALVCSQLEELQDF